MKLWLFSQTNSSPFHSTVFWTHNDPPTLTQCDETWLIKTELCESFSLDEVELSQVESRVDLCSLLHPTASVSFTVCFLPTKYDFADSVCSLSSQVYALFRNQQGSWDDFNENEIFFALLHTIQSISSTEIYFPNITQLSLWWPRPHRMKTFFYVLAMESWRVGWCESSTATV